MSVVMTQKKTKTNSLSLNRILDLPCPFICFCQVIFCVLSRSHTDTNLLLTNNLKQYKGIKGLIFFLQEKCHATQMLSEKFHC